MSETKHTPGPWTFNGNASPLRGTVTATVNPDERGRTKEIVAHLPGNDGVVQGHVEANARLIAAAPEMLEALKAAERLAWEVGSESDDGVNTILEDSRGDLWRQIRDVLAKAEGWAK